MPPKLKKWILPIYCLFLCSLSLNSQPDSLRANEYYAQGEQYLLKGKPTKAIPQFRKVLTINGELTAAWRALGSSYELLDQYDSTIVHYQKVIELNPYFSRVIYYEIGRAYYRSGQYRQSLEYFQQYKELQKEDITKYGFNGQRELRYEKKYLSLLPQNIQACKTALELLNFSNVEVIHNLGDSINTAGNEYFPYLSNNQQVFYYTTSTFDLTDMNKKAQNEDLYNSRAFEENRMEVDRPPSVKRPSTVHRFKKGRAVDSLITTSGNEGMSTFTKDDRQMVFTSCAPIENGVNCDLHLARMEKDADNFLTDEAGRFFFCLPANQTLKVEIDKEGFYSFADTFYIPPWDNQTLYPLELLLQPIDLSVQASDTLEVSDALRETLQEDPLPPITFEVYFNFDDFGLNRAATLQLEKFMKKLGSTSFEKIEIIGFADTTGPSDYNLDLSLKRASNVAWFLRQYGLEASQTITEGKGESLDFKDKGLNRRVRIIFHP